MNKRKLNKRNTKVKYTNPNPKGKVRFEGEALDTLTRIRQKMVAPGKEIRAKMITPYLRNVHGEPVTESYLRSVLNRLSYTSLDRLIEIENIVDDLQSKMPKVA